jgi:NAD(P)-dependent dehydrogenase (short-subunit alcohol dehydrogenase family)
MADPILVTGASSGISASPVERFAGDADGHTVVRHID